MEFVWIELECGNNDADAAQLTLDLKNIHDSTSATVKLYTEPNRVKNSETQGFHILQPTTDNCLAETGKDLRDTKAVCFICCSYRSPADKAMNFLNDFAPESGHLFGKLPGLVCKFFIANDETNAYGGLYFWNNVDDMLAYVDGKPGHLLDGAVHVKQEIIDANYLVRPQFVSYKTV